MSAVEKTISAFIPSQLPDFVNADHPKFKQFIQYYYKWLETNNPGGISNTAGNTVYQAMNIGDYRDIDSAPTEFIQYFIRELLPYFPEDTKLDVNKLLKNAREFYNKKGSLNSVEWLFKAIYGENIQITFPKEEIFKASDGKWLQPRAFRVLNNERTKNLNVALLQKKKATGNTGGATCVVEAVDRTIDATNGKEIIEIYISNLTRYFQNGEYITIFYIDENGVEKTFSEKIIGTVSGVFLDSNIKTDPQQKKKGEYYNVGDPVVFTTGLARTPEAADAVAIVGNVSQGSIESITLVYPGYGFRLYQNSIVTVYRNIGDDPQANANTDLRITALNLTACTSNSQRNFAESIWVDKTAILDIQDEIIGNANLQLLTVTNRNVVLNITEGNKAVFYTNNELVWANGTNYADALFTAKILTPNNTIFGLNGPSANTGDAIFYDVANTGALATILNGATLYTANTNKAFTFNSVTSTQVDANANSQLIQIMDFEQVNTGGVALITVQNGGFGFRSVPNITIASVYGTNSSEDYSEGSVNWANTVQTLSDLGAVAHVYINNGGSGYTNGDTITFAGSGYGGNGNVSVDGTGKIISVNLFDRGEGYFLRPNVVINTSGGTGASLTAYLFGDGYLGTPLTGKIGRIKDLRLVYRGFDYVGTPNVSLKVMDVVIDGISDSESLRETEYVFQGASIETSTFRANVDSYNRETKVLRLYDYTSNIDTGLSITSQNNVTFNVNTLANVPAPAQYPAQVVFDGLPNPFKYGDGKAKAYATFANGIITFPGFFLNTDGFSSADKKLQDDKRYHNFSYAIQTEKALLDYQTTLFNIVHPVGMSLISKTVARSQDENKIAISSNVAFVSKNGATEYVTVSNSYANTVTGTNTKFLPNVNVGDLFIIDSGISAPLRTQVKTVLNVASNTSLNVQGDFIYVGQGKLQVINANSVAIVSGNTNAVSEFIVAGDKLRFNVTNINISSGTVNVSGSVVTGTGTHFVGNVVVGSEIRVNSEVRLVQTVTNDTSLIVNTAFTNAATNKYLYANSVYLKTVSGVSGGYITMNSAVFSNSTELVYQVIPDLSSSQYSFKVITMTSGD